MTDTDDAFIAKDSPSRLVLLGLASLGFVAAGLWMTGLFGEVPTVGRWSAGKVQLVGWAGAVFFGLMDVVIVQRLRKIGEAFRIDANGITHAQMVKQSFSWDEITALQPMQVGNQQMVCYDVVQHRLDQMSGLRGKLAAANRKMTGCAFSLATAGTDAKLPEVIAALEHFAPPRLLVTD